MPDEIIFDCANNNGVQTSGTEVNHSNFDEPHYDILSNEGTILISYNHILNCFTVKINWPNL